MNRQILHVDLNSFFASVEQQCYPHLRGKPVGIIKSLGRSCVIACSNEAKKYGLKTGMNLSQVKSLCPKIILLPADFPKYSDVTRRFINLCSSYTNQMEIFSLDEVFLDVTSTSRLFGGPLLLAYDIQQRLKKELGDWLGCSIGIAKNKLLAKIASNLTPKRSVFVVTDQTQTDLLAKAPFEEVCGIGFRLTKRLKTMGIVSLPQILSASDKKLKIEFGPFWSQELKRIARGEDDSKLVTIKDLPDAKSVSRTYTLYKDTNDQNQIKALIRNLVEEACFKLRKMGLVGRQFGISVRGDHFLESKHLTTKTFTDDSQPIFKQVYKIFKSFNWPHPVRFAGIWISLLTRKNYLSLPLFKEDIIRNKLIKTIDNINDIYGHHTVHPASMLSSKIIRPEINGFLGDKQFHLKFRTLNGV
ncbi:MAG: DNA polymerase IV [Candidatus Beckwithbacteria bacterium]|nr:DNA polymerase IV [Patescibacteria group bacterium]